MGVGDRIQNAGIERIIQYIRDVIDIEKFYRKASRLVGDLNRDLVHHVFEKTHDKLPSDNPDAYFYRSMMNELRSDSKFRRNYDRIRIETEEQFEAIEINTERVQGILNELSAEGFGLEVKVFLEMANESAHKIKKVTGVRYENLLNIRNFIRNEVIQRYGHID